MRPSENAAAATVVALRPAKLHRGETEFLPAALEIVDTPASPLGRAIALFIAAFLAVAVAWASFGEVDIIATAQGRVIPTGKSKLIQPYETGVVRRIGVEDGTIVRAGGILVELDPTTDASDETRAAFGLIQDRLDIARLQALLDDNPDLFKPDEAAEPRMSATARSQMEAQAAEHHAKLDGLDRRIAQKRIEGREIATAIEKIEVISPHWVVRVEC